MIYLLDVNTLLALGLREHVFHERVAHWMKGEALPLVGTCSITELGFLRVSMQMGLPGYDMEKARTILLRVKQSSLLKHHFLADGHDESRLPNWVKTAKQLTDGHLLALAEAHGAMLATLDERIPGAYLIPRT